MTGTESPVGDFSGVPDGGPWLGQVESFDQRAGLGTVLAGNEVRLPFHCTAIVGGSRQLDQGAMVSFSVRPGRLGRWEASNLVVSAARS